MLFISNATDVVAIIQPKLSDPDAQSILVEFDPPLTDPFAILMAIKPLIANPDIIRIRTDPSKNWIIDLAMEDVDKILQKDSKLLKSKVIANTKVANNTVAEIDRANSIKYVGDTLGLTDDELNDVAEQIASIANDPSVRLNLWSGSNYKHEPIAVLYVTTNTTGRRALIQHGPIVHNGRKLRIKQAATMSSRVQNISNAQQYHYQRLEQVQQNQQQYEQQFEARMRAQLEQFQQQQLVPITQRLDQIEPAVESLKKGQQAQTNQYNTIQTTLNTILSRLGDSEDEVEEEQKPHKKLRKH